MTLDALRAAYEQALRTRDSLEALRDTMILAYPDLGESDLRKNVSAALWIVTETCERLERRLERVERNAVAA